MLCKVSFSSLVYQSYRVDRQSQIGAVVGVSRTYFKYVNNPKEMMSAIKEMMYPTLYMLVTVWFHWNKQKKFVILEGIY